MRPDKNISADHPKVPTDEMMLSAISSLDKQGRMLNMGFGQYIKISLHKGGYCVQYFEKVNRGKDGVNFEPIPLKEGAQTMFQNFAREVLGNGKPELTMLQKITGQMLLIMEMSYDLPKQTSTREKSLLEKAILHIQRSKDHCLVEPHRVSDDELAMDKLDRDEQMTLDSIPGRACPFIIVKP